MALVERPVSLKASNLDKPVQCFDTFLFLRRRLANSFTPHLSQLAVQEAVVLNISPADSDQQLMHPNIDIPVLWCTTIPLPSSGWLVHDVIASGIYEHDRLLTTSPLSFSKVRRRKSLNEAKKLRVVHPAMLSTVAVEIYKRPAARAQVETPTEETSRPASSRQGRPMLLAARHGPESSSTSTGCT